MSAVARRLEDLDALVDEMEDDGVVTRHQAEAYGVVRELLKAVLYSHDPVPATLCSYFEEAHRDAITALMD